MGYKRSFNEVMQKFAAEHADELAQLTPEQVAERTGYTLATVQDYFRRQQLAQRQAQRQKESERSRALATGALTFIPSSGSARVIYYPQLGEVQIISTHPRLGDSQTSWNLRDQAREAGDSLFLSPQDTLEIGIYLMGLQPHIRDVLARAAKGESLLPEPSAPTEALEDDL